MNTIFSARRFFQPESRKMTEKIDTTKPAKEAPRAPSKAARKKSKFRKSSSRGRPEWVPSIDERTSVEHMKFCGESEALIARSMKVDVKSLRKHCRYELENGHANRRRQVIKKLFEAADEGNVSAIKRLDEIGRMSRRPRRSTDRVR
jgi:hypothetical protein